MRAPMLFKSRRQVSQLPPDPAIRLRLQGRSDRHADLCVQAEHRELRGSEVHRDVQASAVRQVSRVYPGLAVSKARLPCLAPRALQGLWDSQAPQGQQDHPDPWESLS